MSMVCRLTHESILRLSEATLRIVHQFVDYILYQLRLFLSVTSLVSWNCTNIVVMHDEFKSSECDIVTLRVMLVYDVFYLIQENMV